MDAPRYSPGAEAAHAGLYRTTENGQNPSPGPVPDRRAWGRSAADGSCAYTDAARLGHGSDRCDFGG
ncbi:hypothetical protein D3C74_433810 [compost metagenome]